MLECVSRVTIELKKKKVLDACARFFSFVVGGIPASKKYYCTADSFIHIFIILTQ